MPGNTVYLEAPDRTQDLLTIKWTLRAAGYAIMSTWHDGGASTSFMSSGDHWNATGVERLQHCDSLIVICGNDERSRPELAMMAGFAIARGVRVIWIGRAVWGLSDFRAVEQFNTVEDFRKQILQQMHSQSNSTVLPLAA
jgi:hypothetical protein